MTKRCVLTGRVPLKFLYGIKCFTKRINFLRGLQELDVKAGGGQMMRIGMMLRQWLVKLEWFSTLFPRIPVPIQQKIQKHLEVSNIQ